MKEKALPRSLIGLLPNHWCLFSETASRYPSNIGLVFGANQYNYETLELTSNQWASYISYTVSTNLWQRITRDTLIALCVDRNEDMIFGMLGI